MFYCEYCGGDLSEGALNCRHCGKEVVHRLSPTDARVCSACEIELPLDAVECRRCGCRCSVQMPKTLRTGYEPVPGAVYCRDGKYRWSGEVNMLRNWTAWGTLLKMYCGLAVVTAVMLAALLINLEGRTEGLKAGLLALKYGLPAAALLSVAVYLLMAVYYGGTYCVIYEMDENGVLYMRMKSYFKKKRAREYISYLSGLKRKPKSITKEDMYRSSKETKYFSFDGVKKVRYNKRTGVIMLKRSVFTDKIYIDPVQFAFIFHYMKKVCKKRRTDQTL